MCEGVIVEIDGVIDRYNHYGNNDHWPTSSFGIVSSFDGGCFGLWYIVLAKES